MDCKRDKNRASFKREKQFEGREIWTLPRSQVMLIQRAILGKLAERMKTNRRPFKEQSE
jgi:hypothetical protein